MEKVKVDNYYELREEMVEKNQNYIGLVLREDEKKLDDKLKALIEECKGVCGGSIPCDSPVLLNPKLWRTGLYSFCKRLPKGADLHVHGTSLMPIWRLIKFLSARDDILIDPESLILYLPRDEHPVGALPVGEALDEGIIDRIELEKKWSVLGADPNKDIWRYFEDLFGYHAAMDCDMNILKDYYLTAFDDCVRNGIYHVELHILLSEDIDESRKIVETVREAYYEVKRKYSFFSASIIGSSMKMFSYSLDETEKILRNTIALQNTVKDEFDPDNIHNFIIGFDLINEEDTSRSLKEYAPMLIGLREEQPDFGYFLHCGESLDSYNDNLIDAYLIGAKRVGHGMNLFRYPDLLRHYVKDEVCLEVCPISNQTLRYTVDTRLHPGAEFMKRGVTMALCSDDPVYQEHEQLTDDFFTAITAWGLGVAEVKQLCINSIMYSALDESSKRQVLRHWHEEWKKFTAEMI